MNHVKGGDCQKLLIVQQIQTTEKYLKGRGQKDQGKGEEQWGHASDSPGTIASAIARCEETDGDTDIGARLLAEFNMPVYSKSPLE